ncbi:TraR/DksA family transcriptional regulator [Halocynthiibacter sp.]|uniref:TraR/DksA family transcriptional regulator n=1 Tax=Halocynthiibacter sp. TaxID=1979210 RepID=UPI003C63148B
MTVKMTLTNRKVQLEKRLSELDTRVHDIEHTLDAPVAKDWEEAAQEAEDTEVLEAMGNQGLIEIRLIGSALKRIETGEYGACEQCGEDIAEARLDLVPHAPLCAKCAR